MHEICLNVFKKYLVHSSLEDFSESEKIDQLTLDWTNKFSEISSGVNYSPHITLGIGSEDNISFPKFKFNVHEAIVFQLGPYCTCKKMLAKFDLK